MLYTVANCTRSVVKPEGVSNVILTKPELSTGRMDPWVGSGWIGSGLVTILQVLLRVGSDQHFRFSSSFYLFLGT